MADFKKYVQKKSREWLCFIVLLLCVCAEVPENCGDGLSPLSQGCRGIGTCNHSWGNWVVITPATCDASGIETRICTKDASHTETRYIPQLTGSQCITGCTQWSSWSITTAATCTAPGVETRTCQVGSAEPQNRSIPQLTGLQCVTGCTQWSNWMVITPATCTAPGIETRTCQAGSAEPQNRSIAQLSDAACHTHTWGNWSVTKSPTCTTPGEETRTCTQNSSHIETRPIAQLTGAQCVSNYFVSSSANQIGWTNPFSSQPIIVKNPTVPSEHITLNASNRLVITPLTGSSMMPWDLQLVQNGFNHIAGSQYSEPIYEVTIAGSTTSPVRIGVNIQGDETPEYVHYAFSFDPDCPKYDELFDTPCVIVPAGDFTKTFYILQDLLGSDPAAQFALSLSFRGNSGILTITTFSIRRTQGY